MCKLDELKAKRDEIYRIAKAHKVEKLYVFGSTARQEETPNSDVDFIAKFRTPDLYAGNAEEPGK